MKKEVEEQLSEINSEICPLLNPKPGGYMCLNLDLNDGNPNTCVGCLRDPNGEEKWQIVQLSH